MLELTNTAYDKKQKGQIWAFFYSLQDSKCHTAIWKNHCKCVFWRPPNLGHTTWNLDKFYGKIIMKNFFLFFINVIVFDTFGCVSIFILTILI